MKSRIVLEDGVDELDKELLTGLVKFRIFRVVSDAKLSELSGTYLSKVGGSILLSIFLRLMFVRFGSLGSRSFGSGIIGLEESLEGGEYALSNDGRDELEEGEAFTAPGLLGGHRNDGNDGLNQLERVERNSGISLGSLSKTSSDDVSNQFTKRDVDGRDGGSRRTG